MQFNTANSNGDESTIGAMNTPRFERKLDDSQTSYVIFCKLYQLKYIHLILLRTIVMAIDELAVSRRFHCMILFICFSFQFEQKIVKTEVKAAIGHVRCDLSLQSSGSTEPEDISITRPFISHVIKRLFNILDCDVISF